MPITLGATLHALRANGTAVAINGFGMGCTNLTLLATLEPDFPKIGKVFGSTFGTGAPAGRVVHHVFTTAHVLHSDRVADGVEPESRAAQLRDLSVTCAHGWRFAKAMPVREFSIRMVAAEATAALVAAST